MPETFVCPSSHCVVRTVPLKEGLGAFLTLLVYLLLHRPCQWGRLRGEAFLEAGKEVASHVGIKELGNWNLTLCKKELDHAVCRCLPSFSSTTPYI